MTGLEGSKSIIFLLNCEVNSHIKQDYSISQETFSKKKVMSQACNIILNMCSLIESEHFIKNELQRNNT